MFSRKIVPIIVACVLSVGLISFAVAKDKWIFTEKSPREKTAGTDSTSGVRILVEKVLEDSADRDDDNDSLKNWEEVFYKTDPNNRDTNNNGILDGEEVRNGQKIAGRTTAEGGNSASRLNEPKTKTEEISRNLFGEYLTLKQTGKLNSDSMQNLITKTISQIDTKESSFYSLSSIKTIPDTDPFGVKNYGNSLVTIREKYKSMYSEQPIITVGGTINFDDGASIESIKRAADLYKAESEDLAKLLVPKSLVAAHTALLNNYVTSSEGLGQLALLRTDPIMAMAGIQKHTTAASEEAGILSSISQFFSSRSISFSFDEPGSRINNI